ncbi:MAG TPA: hypothetical protein VN715_04770 [Roseiarcus sp.]|nr:hypothetical protein [Roseiarcus sp.]
MSWGSLAATALHGLANVVGGKAVGPASPFGDVSTAVGASISVLKEVEARRLTFTDAETFANAVQQILVDLSIEPGIVLAASKLLEAVAPAFIGAWRSGIVTGGYPNIVAQENDSNFKNR